MAFFAAVFLRPFPAQGETFLGGGHHGGSLGQGGLRWLDTPSVVQAPEVLSQFPLRSRSVVVVRPHSVSPVTPRQRVRRVMDEIEWEEQRHTNSAVSGFSLGEGRSPDSRPVIV